MTASGDDPNKPCIFPFNIHGGTQYGCLIDNPDEPAWCSTKTDGDGNHIGFQGNWGYCDVSKCPMPDGKYCISRF